jgi:Xaa-Pro aminopeptidase
MLVIAAGVGFSETVLVTETGHEPLTPLDPRLIES